MGQVASCCIVPGSRLNSFAKSTRTATRTKGSKEGPSLPEIPERLTPKSQQVAAKVVDGEAVIINLANGVYYSMDKAGGLIWSMIEQAQSLDAIADAVAAAYDVSSVRAREDVEQLAAQLVSEDLVGAKRYWRVATSIGLHSTRPDRSSTAQTEALSPVLRCTTSLELASK